MIVFYFVASYLIGTFLTAYFVAKAKGVDIGNEGSGNIGARNIGGVIGRQAFFVTMLGDALKGAIVVVSGYALGYSMTIVLLALSVCTIGHLYPFWNKFKGGKGVATGIGGMLFVTPLSAGLLLVGFLVVFLFTRSVTFGMLGAFFVIESYFIYEFGVAALALLAVIFIIIWAMRSNLLERIKGNK